MNFFDCLLNLITSLLLEIKLDILKGIFEFVEVLVHLTEPKNIVSPNVVKCLIMIFGVLFSVDFFFNILIIGMASYIKLDGFFTDFIFDQFFLEVVRKVNHFQ